MPHFMGKLLTQKVQDKIPCCALQAEVSQGKKVNFFGKIKLHFNWAFHCANYNVTKSYLEGKS